MLAPLAPLAAAAQPDHAVEGVDFLELVLGDPDLLEAEFTAIIGEDGLGESPPGKSLVVAEADEPGGPVVPHVSTSGARRFVTVPERNPRRRNRQRSPPPSWTALAREH